MATSSRTMSPGAALLRSSRMFSLPKPIRPPPTDSRVTKRLRSESNTALFPTRQTVTTPDKFRRRGDWGFKRYLPHKSTRTSTPYIRINQVDSIEHITDFASSADHTLSLEKWLEMNVPLLIPHSAPVTTGLAPFRTSLIGMKPISAFDTDHDFTALDDEKIQRSGDMRWKFKGPWLAKLTNGEFGEYLKRGVRPRRPEFREFLRKHLAPKMTEDLKRHAAESHGQGEAAKVKAIEACDIKDDEFTAFLRQLRENRATLFELVGKFLDLAPLVTPSALDSLGPLKPPDDREVRRENPYALEGPPITHPSAGLCYLRTNSYLDNHPVYGPQMYHPPVKGRILMSARDVSRSLDRNGSLGVNGFVVGSGPVSPKTTGKNGTRVPRHLGLTDKGGPKMWAHVYSARINSEGRAIIHAEESTSKVGNESRLVQEEMLGEKRVFHASLEDASRYLLDSKQLWQSQPRSSSSLSSGHIPPRYVHPSSPAKITNGSRTAYLGNMAL